MAAGERGSQASSAPGNPSLEKCRALKEQREEAAEVASLDVTNIISYSGEGLLPLPRNRWGLDFLRQLISVFPQVGHGDARPGTLQSQPPPGSYTAGPWTRRKSGTVPHAQTGLICVASSAATARVTRLPHLPGGTLYTCRKHTYIAPPANPNSVPKEKHLSSDLKPPGAIAGILFLVHVLSLKCLQFIF